MTSGAWHDIVLAILKANDVKLAPYVPDRAFAPLLRGLHADPFFTAFACTREEEAVGVAAGGWMAGMRSVVVMQSSGFATIPNVLGSLNVPAKIPLLMLISERDSPDPSNAAQALVARTMRPTLEALGIAHHSLRAPADLALIGSGIKDAVSRSSSVAFLLSDSLVGD